MDACGQYALLEFGIFAQSVLTRCFDTAKEAAIVRVSIMKTGLRLPTLYCTEECASARLGTPLAAHTNPTRHFQQPIF